MLVNKRSRGIRPPFCDMGEWKIRFCSMLRNFRQKCLTYYLYGQQHYLTHQKLAHNTLDTLKCFSSIAKI